MDSKLNLNKLPEKQLGMNPKKFILWMFMVSIIMIFAALTSGFIVRQAEGNWLKYQLPTELWVSTILLLLSSITAQLAINIVKRTLAKIRLFLLLTITLGILFLVTQLWVWNVLVQNNVFFVGNPGGSFLYVLMGVHAFHLITALLYLFIMLFKSYRVNTISEIQFQLKLSVTYWHFLDILWIYLYLFLTIYH